MTGIKILATGAAVPKALVTNEDLAQIVDTSDEWISKRTGMKLRHHAKDGETNLDLASQAARQAIDRAGIDKDEIGAVIVATVTGDYVTPATACLVQKELGLSNDIIAFDLSAGCSGFVFGLETMRGLLATRDHKYGLLIASELLTRRVDMTDRGTCVLFGDGAAAAVIESSNDGYASVMGVDGNPDMIKIKSPDGYIEMDGQGTYKFAVATVPELIEDAVKKSGKTFDEIHHYILHQANLRIIESIAKKIGQPMEKFIVNIDKYGNTSAASVGIALNEAIEDGRIKEKDTTLICAFGAGKTWGAIVLG
ncbi:MAG: ketoacyl-ACP synthase III [Pseudobutyrivibrio sp.]|nr:ketoacyl-ACP synthase III [Pseudobutyrivibrio sp.]